MASNKVGLETVRMVIGVVLQLVLVFPVGLMLQYLGFRVLLIRIDVHAWWAPIPLMMVLYLITMAASALNPSRGDRVSR